MFIKQKTAYEMRISDWSSDVCSSDLPFPMPLIAKAKRHDGMGSALHSRAPRKLAGRWQLPPHPFYRTQPVKSAAYNEIGLASCRDRLCQYVYISFVAFSFKNYLFFFFLFSLFFFFLLFFFFFF